MDDRASEPVVGEAVKEQVQPEDSPENSRRNCSVCQRIEAWKRENERGRRFTRGGGPRFEHGWHHRRTREYVKRVKAIIKRHEEDPDALRKVRWNARWPDYRGGGPAPEYDGYVWGSFAVEKPSEPLTLLSFVEGSEEEWTETSAQRWEDDSE